MEVLASLLTRHLSAEGQRFLRRAVLVLVLGLMLHLLNSLRTGYFGALTNAVNENAVNDVEIAAGNAVE